MVQRNVSRSQFWHESRSQNASKSSSPADEDVDEAAAFPLPLLLLLSELLLLVLLALAVLLWHHRPVDSKHRHFEKSLAPGRIPARYVGGAMVDATIASSALHADVEEEEEATEAVAVVCDTVAVAAAPAEEGMRACGKSGPSRCCCGSCCGSL